MLSLIERTTICSTEFPSEKVQEIGIQASAKETVNKNEVLSDIQMKIAVRD